MANLGFIGAETGDTSELDSIDSIAVDATIKNTGLYSYKLSFATSGTLNIAASDEPRAGFYFRTDTLGSSRGLCGFNNSTTGMAIVELNASDKLVVQTSVGTGVAGSTTLSADTWYFIELRYKKGTGSDAVAEVRLNGSIEATSSTGDRTLQADIFSLEGGPASGLHWFDDIRLRDAAYPGDGFVAGLRPDAIGDEDNFTNGFAEIDDDPIDDTTLREAPGSGPIPFLNDVGALTVSTIDEVRVRVRASRTSGSGRSHFIRWKKPGGTAENSADLGLGSGVGLFSFTPSDQPTTQAHIDDMQGGMSQSAAGGRLAECTELWIMADYTLSAGPAARIPDDRVRRMAPILAQ